MSLFGKTTKQWREQNPKEKGNIRDYANVSQLVCLSNLENLNAVFINDKLPQAERLTKLNQIAIPYICGSLFCLGFVLYPNLKICLQLLLGVETLLSYKT
jgi:hypothetical protein